MSVVQDLFNTGWICYNLLLAITVCLVYEYRM